jgi:hypothetical protein
MLLDHGADVLAVTHGGVSALILVCRESMWHDIRGDSECVQLLIDAKADVRAATDGGETAAHGSSMGEPKSLQLLIDNNADVNACTGEGITPAMVASRDGSPAYMSCMQLLVDNNADLNLRDAENYDVLCRAIAVGTSSFAVLCCNTDAKNVEIDDERERARVTEAAVAACIEDYKHTQAYIDEYHRILKLMLSENVPVDPRFGLGQMGIYQEP